MENTEFWGKIKWTSWGPKKKVATQFTYEQTNLHVYIHSLGLTNLCKTFP